MPGHRYWLASARKALGLTQAKLAEILKCDPGTVSRWETGERLPSLSQMQKLAVALKRPLIEVLQCFGMVDNVAGPTSVPTSSTLQVADSTPFQLCGVAPPGKVVAGDVGQVRLATTQLGYLANAQGGDGMVRMTGHAQLCWAGALLRADCEPGLRAELFAAVAQLAFVVGAAAFDAYVHQEARTAYSFAIQAAEEIGDWHLRCRGYVLRARQEIWVGDPDQGLTFIEHASVRMDRLSAVEQAMVYTVRSRALAAMGRVKDAVAAVGAADEAFARRGGDEPVWMMFYDEAQHQGDTGHALFDLAVKGDEYQAAVQRLSAAVEGHSEGYVRSREFSRLKLASLQMHAGDPDQAAENGQLSVPVVETLHSRRALDCLKELRKFAVPHQGLQNVGELCHRIDVLEAHGH